MFTPRSPKVAISLLSSICWHRDQSVICLLNWTLSCNLQISIVDCVTTKHFASRWSGRVGTLVTWHCPQIRSEIYWTHFRPSNKAVTNLAPRPHVNTWISWESCVTPALASAHGRHYNGHLAFMSSSFLITNYCQEKLRALWAYYRLWKLVLLH